MQKPFPFQMDIVGKNVHTVFVICPACHHRGVNVPLETVCGNCGQEGCITYYDAETIHNYLTSRNRNVKESRTKGY